MILTSVIISYINLYNEAVILTSNEHTPHRGTELTGRQLHTPPAGDSARNNVIKHG